MRLRYLVFLLAFLLLGFFITAEKAQAANISISTNVNFCFTLWYGSNRDNVSPTWGGQCIWTGNVSYSGMPTGWYTWSIEGWPSGYRLTGISGDAYQFAGSASWSVSWARDRYNLNVNVNGGGHVTGSGINCPGDCSESYQAGNAVEYFHSEDSGWSWGGWSGACGGPGCIIYFDSDKSLNANFNFTPPQPTASIWASPNPVNYNQSTNVGWSSSNASSCSAGGTLNTWQGSISPLSGSSWSPPLTQSHTLTISCSGPGGTSPPASVNVIVNPPPRPSASISTNPQTVAYNQPTLVSWSSSNVNSCSAGGSLNTWQGSVNPLNGSSWTPPLTANHTLTISCSGPGGPASASASVYIASPTADIKANGVDGSLTIDFNKTVTISWSSSSAGSCTATGTQDTWTGPINPSGGSSESPRLKATKTFGILCYGANGSQASDSVVVNVRGGPIANLKVNDSDGPVTVNWGSKVVLSWSTTEVTSCNATGTLNTWQGPIATSSSSVSLSQRTSPELKTSHTLGISCTGTDGQTYTDNVAVNVVGGPASCTGGRPESITTSKTSGSFSLFADGVSSNATQVLFPTWTDAIEPGHSGPQGDTYWYPGRKLNSNTWTTDVDLARHTGSGHVNVHIYVYPGEVLCATADFYKVASGKIEVKIDAGVSWTLEGPYKTYTGSGPTTLSDVPCGGTYKLIPAARPGFDLSVTPSSSQLLGCP